MSQVTFNIDDYRPLFRVRSHESGPALKPRTGSLVLSPSSQAQEYEREWFEARTAVVDIRSVRESPRPSPRRAKILRFATPASHRVYTMPAPQSRHMLEEDDPGPLVA